MNLQRSSRALSFISLRCASSLTTPPSRKSSRTKIQLSNYYPDFLNFPQPLKKSPLEKKIFQTNFSKFLPIFSVNLFKNYARYRIYSSSRFHDSRLSLSLWSCALNFPSFFATLHFRVIVLLQFRCGAVVRTARFSTRGSDRFF